MSAPNETTQTFKGTVSGVITTERQGEHGFGYDPIFYVPEKVKLWLNLLQQKRVSHRGNAIKKLNAYLESEK